MNEFEERIKNLEEMIDYPNVILGGVAKFLQEAATSKVSLFI